MTTIQIERKKNVAPEDFARDHLQGEGKPVIITDAIDRWPARSKWSLEFLKAAYGSDFVLTFGLSSGPAKVTRLSTYVDHLVTPSDELPGFWVDSDGRPLKRAPHLGDSPLYLQGWHAFQRHPELYADIAPPLYFVADWVLALNPTLQEVLESCGREYWSVYIGPTGTLSPLHQDFWHTHGCLAQIQGRKRAILFSPKDTDLLYRGAVDPEEPDLKRFELFDRATAYECVIEPGDVLFMPANWWHWVKALDKSITVSHNFFNSANFNEHLAGLIRKLPTLAKGIDASPRWREQMRVAWHLKDFADPIEGHK